MRIDIEKIQEMIAERRAFNALDLKELEFYENGVWLDISPELIKDFDYTGLNNVDFVDCRPWEDELFMQVTVTC